MCHFAAEFNSAEPLTIFGALGSGASGSSTINARLLVFGGTPDHSNGGERSSPSQRVYTGGIEALLANAEDERVNFMTEAVVRCSAARAVVKYDIQMLQSKSVVVPK